jgi:hypothetical protein
MCKDWLRVGGTASPIYSLYTNLNKELPMMNVDKFLEIKPTFDHMMNMRQSMAAAEMRIKKAVLKLNDQNPTDEEFKKMSLHCSDDEFTVGTWTKNIRATKDAVATYIEENPGYAVVTHTPTSADDIKVGDIYFSSWGATMSMITFFKVVKRTKHFVTLRVLEQLEKHDDMFAGTSMPLDEFENHSNVYDDERFEDEDGFVYGQRTVKVNPEGNGSAVLRYKDFMWCWPWDGRAKFFDHCD